MADIKDKLKQLIEQQGLVIAADLEPRNDAPPPARPAPPLNPQAPADRLRSLLAHHGLATGVALERTREEQAERLASGEFDIDHWLPGESVGEGGPQCYVVCEDFPLDCCQGDVPLGAALEAVPGHIALSACDDQLEAFDPATTFFT
ncbi:MAG TPA: hypothetical protein ENN80_01920, partial [Candidatus Hydrogenedentes bacterium]|nr:hypothetical protein [Candidatus Hydrogenedentota bacterium]